MQTIFLCEAIFNFPWVWKRTCWNRNRYNWNELSNAHIAVIHYGKWNWYILRQLWRMYQMKCILQFAAVPIYVMLVIIRQYQFSCVDDYNHVHYAAHIFWSRYAYSGKHHAVPVSSYVTIFQFQNHHPTGQQKTNFENNLSILIFRKLLMPNLHLYWEWVVNTLRPRQNGRHFADDAFQRIFLNENV